VDRDKALTQRPAEIAIRCRWVSGPFGDEILIRFPHARDRIRSGYRHRKGEFRSGQNIRSVISLAGKTVMVVFGVIVYLQRLRDDDDLRNEHFPSLSTSCQPVPVSQIDTMSVHMELWFD
jgi:hypothetical protein